MDTAPTHAPERAIDITVERPLLKVPSLLIIDDAAPGIHVYHRHVRDVHQEAPVTKDGRPLQEFVPNDFMRRFVQLVKAHGMKGKLSVVPNPGGDGSIAEAVSGVSLSDLRSWLRMAAVDLRGRFDLGPEMITHNLAVDLDTGAFVPLSESEWSQTQSEASLTRYVAAALQIMKQAGLQPTGVTSPWVFGLQVEPAYVRAILSAMRQVAGRTICWYFLRVGSPDSRPEVMLFDPAEQACVVSITPSVASDFFWETIDTPDTSAAYVSRVADQGLSEEGSHGAFLEVMRAGGWLIWYTHWQSLFSNGLETGLQALGLLAARLRRLLADRLMWITPLEAAIYAAAAHRLTVWASSANNGTLSLRIDSPFGCRNLTFSAPVAPAPRCVTCNGRPLRRRTHPASALMPNSWFHRNGTLYAAVDTTCQTTPISHTRRHK